MERIEELIAKKRHIFSLYRDQLDGLPVTLNPEPAGTVNGYWMPSMVVTEGVPFVRDRLLTIFHSENIDGRVFFWPLSMLPMFEKYPENSMSYSIYHRAINLPSYHDLSEADIKRVTQHIRILLES